MKDRCATHQHTHTHAHTSGLSECFEVNGYSKKVGGGCEQRWTRCDTHHLIKQMQLQNKVHLLLIKAQPEQWKENI